MKKGILFKKTTSAALAVLVAVSTLFSFGISAEAKAKSYVKSIKTAKSKVTLNEGKKVKVKVTVKVKGKASKKFTVKSSKKSAATAKVSGSNVIITAKKAGKATITVTTKAKSSKGKALKAKITVNVKKNIDYNKEITYKVGKDIKAGIYTAKQVGNYKGFFSISSDAKGENNYVVELFKGKRNFKVNDGEYLTVSACTISEAKNPDANNNYCVGRYSVGKDIPGGKYIAYTFESEMGTLKTMKDKNKDKNDYDNIIEIETFYGQNYFNIEDGEYLLVSGCELRDVKFKKKSAYKEGQAIGVGQYLVGDDIPEGVYNLTADDDTSGFYSISKDVFNEYVYVNDNYKGKYDIKVNEGEYLSLSRCSARLRGDMAGESKTYCTGVYKVGEEIPAGKYIAYSVSETLSFFTISTDADASEKIAEDRYCSQHYLEVKDGEWLTLSRAEMCNVKDKKKFEYKAGQKVSNGQFLAGDDIPAGEYVLSQNEDSRSGMCYITSDANALNIVDDIISVKGESTIKVKNGDYLNLLECDAVLKN